MKDFDNLLCPKEVAAKLGVHVRTLANWRSSKKEQRLPYIKIGFCIRYCLSDVNEFLKKRGER